MTKSIGQETHYIIRDANTGQYVYTAAGYKCFWSERNDALVFRSKAAAENFIVKHRRRDLGGVTLQLIRYTATVTLDITPDVVVETYPPRTDET